MENELEFNGTSMLSLKNHVNIYSYLYGLPLYDEEDEDEEDDLDVKTNKDGFDLDKSYSFIIKEEVLEGERKNKYVLAGITLGKLMPKQMLDNSLPILKVVNDKDYFLAESLEQAECIVFEFIDTLYKEGRFSYMVTSRKNLLEDAIIMVDDKTFMIDGRKKVLGMDNKEIVLETISLF